MARKRRAPIREAILKTLERMGPMSITDIAAEMDWPRGTVEKAIVGTRHDYPGQHFQIVAYKWQEYGQGREIPIYAAQGGVDKPRPRASKERHRAQKRAYYARHKARINAKSRAKRLGISAAPNPWLQLAHPDMRPFMSRVQ